MTQHSEKEIALFEAVLSLIEGGQNPYQMKVSDIAARAGIGKGTVYEYFKSKEELLCHALWYRIDCELDAVQQAMESAGTFAQMLSALMDAVYHCMRSRASLLPMLFTQDRGCDLQAYLNEHQTRLQQVTDRFRALIEHCVAAGVQEGVIAPQPAPFAMAAFFSLLSSLCFLTCRPPSLWGGAVDLPTAKRICSTLLCESLKAPHAEVLPS